MRALVTSLALMVASCTFPDVTYGDASVLESGLGDAATEAAQPDSGCDEDNDGWLGPQCGGTDCNDHDPRVHPGAGDGGFIYDVPDAFPNGDWNCDGTVDVEWPFVSCGPTSCQAQTFAFDAGCGVTAPFVTCSTLVTCAAVDAGTRTQGCR